MSHLPTIQPDPLLPANAAFEADIAATPISVYLRYIALLVRRHTILVGSVTAVFVGAAVAFILLTPQEYVARAVVRIEDTRGQLTAGIDNGGSSRGVRPPADVLQTEIEILTSRQVIGRAVDASGVRIEIPESRALERVIERLHVEPDAPERTLTLRFMPAGYTVTFGDTVLHASYGTLATAAGAQFIVHERPAGQASAVLEIRSRDAAIRRVAGQLVPTPRRSSNIVDVVFRSESARMATDMANRIVDAFVEVDTELARQWAKRRREFLERQVVVNDSVLKQTQLELSQFRVRNRVVSQSGRVAAHQSALIDVELRRSEIEGWRRHYQGLLSQLTGAPEPERRDRLRTLMATPEITRNPVISHIYSQMLAYEVARDTLLTRWQPEHPDVRHLEDMVQSLEAQVVEAVRGHIAALDAQIETLDELGRATAGEVAAATMSPEAEVAAVQLEGQVETMQRMAELVRAEAQRARIEEAVEAGLVQVLDLPSGLADPVNSRDIQILTLVLLMGLLAGTALAHVRESLDTSIHVREDIEPTIHIPTLVTVPRLLPPTGNGGDRKHAELNGTNDGRTRYLRGREAFRMLGTSLICAADGSAATAPRTVLVTSALPGEGKTTTAANLGVAQAESGERVLIIDCDTSRPAIHQLFGVGCSPGLVQVLRGQVPLRAALRGTHLGPAVLPAGDTDATDTPALNRTQMLALTRELADSFDLIVLDAPPVLVMANAAILATIADAVLLVVRSGQTDRAAARTTIEQLRLVGAPLRGVVLNDADGDLERYGGAYHAVEYYSHI